MTRFQTILKYFRNDRIRDYKEILQSALQNQYSVLSLRDYALGNHAPSKKILLLRHDIDFFSRGTRLMFEIEKKLGVTSSFYFRHSTVTPKLLREIEAYGSEASLHFETISDFLKANPQIKNKNDLLKTDFKARCLRMLREELSSMRSRWGIPCLTIAGHGAKENSLFQTPNNLLTENTKVYPFLEIILEAYNQEFLKKVTCYISDIPIEINGGYRYGMHPLSAISKNENCIIFLTHPNHWHFSPMGVFKKILKVVFWGNRMNPEIFRRI